MDSEIAGLKLEIPEGWFDTTDDLPSGAPPTLTAKDGCGALHFSVARYKAGQRPNIRVDDLKEMLKEFFEHHSLGPVDPIIVRTSKTPCVGATVSMRDQVLGFYYLSDGTNVTFVSYTCLEPGHPALEAELRAVARIIESIRFS